MDLKNTLKTLKLNESTISMVLGALVIIVVAVLVFNYFRNLPEGGTLESGSQENQNQESYIVQPGDNLWTIAQSKLESGFEWQKIAEANNLTNPGQIETGQELTIPSKEEKAVVKTEEVNSSQKIDSQTTYTIVKGDSLWTIAVRAYGDGFQWTKIASENKLENPDIIHVGNTLVLSK